MIAVFEALTDSESWQGNRMRPDSAHRAAMGANFTLPAAGAALPAAMPLAVVGR